MRRAFLALLLASPILAEEAARVPLCILGNHYLRIGDERALPLASIGSAPEGSATLPPFLGLVSRLEGARLPARDRAPSEDELAGEALAEALTDGTARLRTAQPGAHALVFLVGPLLNSGERWWPTELSREGNTFRVVVTSWRDNGPRHRNVPMRPTILMTLGELAAGDYELSITYRGLFLDVEQDQPHYAMNASHEGSLPFHVVATPAEEGQAVSLPQGALRVTEIEPGEPDQGKLSGVLYRLDLREAESVSPSVQAGSFDWVAWARQEESSTTPPTLEAPGERGTVCACVLGPRLNSQEWMSLASVTWTGDGVQLRVEVWRDQGERDKNIPYTPLLVVPLDRPPKAGTHRVDVEWVTLHAPMAGGLYQPEHDPLLEPVHTDFEIR